LDISRWQLQPPGMDDSVAIKARAAAAAVVLDSRRSHRVPTAAAVVPVRPRCHGVMVSSLCCAYDSTRAHVGFDHMVLVSQRMAAKRNKGRATAAGCVDCSEASDRYYSRM